MVAYVLVVALHVAAPTQASPACMPSDVDSSGTVVAVRSTNQLLSDRIAHALLHSVTFAEMAARIATARVVVYAVWRPSIKAGLAGALLHDLHRGADGTRYLRVFIERGRSERATIATLAHELQHVVEFIEQGKDDFDAASAMPGGSVRTARSDLRVYETTAARRVQAAVSRELAACGGR